MANKQSKPTDHEALLVKIRAAVKKAGGKRPAFHRFLAEAGIAITRFYKHYTGWQEALKAAGFDFEPHGIIDPPRLLADWGAVVRKINRVPSVMAYDLHGKYCSSTIGDRFDSYRNIPRAFEKFAAGKREWADVLAICAKRPKHDRRTRPRGRPRKMRPRPVSGAAAVHTLTGGPIPGRHIFGEPLHLHGISSAPVNESGVVFLFGMLAWRLGFHVETLRVAFPDCEAMRRVGSGKWQRVTIEFEYESRNFRIHGHDPKACDLIVCWEHNWSDCPKNLEVIALKDELERLGRA